MLSTTSPRPGPKKEAGTPPRDEGSTGASDFGEKAQKKKKGVIVTQRNSPPRAPQKTPPHRQQKHPGKKKEEKAKVLMGVGGGRIGNIHTK